MHPTSVTTSPLDDAARSAALLGREQLGGSALVVGGFLQMLQGVVALSSPGVYNGVDYAYAYDLDAWGWGLIGVGAVALVVGAALLLGQEWARICGILVALFSALASFMLVPQAPAWALVVIGLDLVVVWAVATVIGQDRPA